MKQLPKPEQVSKKTKKILIKTQKLHEDNISLKEKIEELTENIKRTFSPGPKK